MNSVGAINDFPSNEKVIITFNLDLNKKVTGQIGAGGTKDVERWWNIWVIYGKLLKGN